MESDDLKKNTQYFRHPAINLLKDIVLDYKKICNRQRIIITILSLLNIFFITCF